MAKILIVDDDEDLLYLMSESLESVGLEHDLAASAEQARDLLKHFRYDFIVSDFNMPRESGLDLLGYASLMRPPTRFVLMTGSDDPRIRREAIRRGVYAYLQKPFYMYELGETIITLAGMDDQKEVFDFALPSNDLKWKNGSVPHDAIMESTSECISNTST